MMEITDMISLVTNVGFPVTLCFILIRYILQTMEEKFDKLEHTLEQLIQKVQSIDRTEKKDDE